MHANTDSKEGFGLFEYGIFQRLDHAIHSAQDCGAISEMADTGQDNPVGAADLVGIVRHNDLNIGPSLRCSDTQGALC